MGVIAIARGRVGIDLRRYKRPRGKGTIVKEGEIYRARLPGSRETVGIDKTYEGAERALDAALSAVDGTAPDDAARMPLAGWMTHCSTLRDRENLRDMATERGRILHHVVRDPFGAIPLALVDAPACRAWVARLCLKGGGGRGVRRAGKPLSTSTINNVMILVRVAFERAVELGVLEASPMKGVKMPRGRKRSTDARTVDAWTVLESEEQQALLRALAPESALVRALVTTALGTGMRRGEILHLRWDDVGLDAREPWVMVRYGKKDSPTKGGRPRRIPLFGLALEAMRAWADIARPRRFGFAEKGCYVEPAPESVAKSAAPLAQSSITRAKLAQSSTLEAETCVHSSETAITSLIGEAPPRLRGCVFPNDRGQARLKIPARAFARALKRAGIDRNVRWHDLRHTCATSLLEGMWGPAWSVTEVQQLLGHKSASTTERYLHARSRLVFRRARESYGFSRDTLRTPPP